MADKKRFYNDYGQKSTSEEITNNNDDESLEENNVNADIDKSKRFDTRKSYRPQRSDNTYNFDIDEYSEYTGDFIPEGGESALRHSRAINQSGLEQAGNAAGRGLINGVLKGVQYTASAVNPESYYDPGEATQSAVNQTMKEWQEAVSQDFMPIYREDPGQSMDIDDSGWWAQMGSSLTSSAIGFVGAGYATGFGASLAIRGASRAARSIVKGGQFTKKGKNAQTFVEWLRSGQKTEKFADRTEKILNKTEGIANAVALNRAEGIAEGTGVYDKTYRNKIEEGLSEFEANEAAADAAAATVNTNMANLPLQLSSAVSFLKPSRRARNAPTQSYGKTQGKKILEESVQESAEEEVATISRKVGMNVGEDKEDVLDGAFNEVASLKGLEAAMLGAVGGAAQTGMTSLANKSKHNPFTGTKDNQGNKISAAKLHNDRYRKNLEEIENQKKIMESNDVPSHVSIYQTAKENLELQAKVNEAKENGDNQKAEELQRTMFAHQVFSGIANGTLHHVEQSHQTIKELSEEKAAEMGLDTNPKKEDGTDNPNYYKNKADEALNLIGKLENHYDHAVNNYNNPGQIFKNRANREMVESSKREKESDLPAKRNALAERANRIAQKMGPVSEANQDGSVSKNIIHSYDFDNFGQTGEQDFYYPTSQEKYNSFVRNVMATNEWTQWKMAKDEAENTEKLLEDLDTEFDQLTSEEAQKEAAKSFEQKIKEQKELSERRERVANRLKESQNNVSFVQKASGEIGTLDTDKKQKSTNKQTTNKEGENTGQTNQQGENNGQQSGQQSGQQNGQTGQQGQQSNQGQQSPTTNQGNQQNNQGNQGNQGNQNPTPNEGGDQQNNQGGEQANADVAGLAELENKLRMLGYSEEKIQQILENEKKKRGADQFGNPEGTPGKGKPLVKVMDEGEGFEVDDRDNVYNIFDKSEVSETPRKKRIQQKARIQRGELTPKQEAAERLKRIDRLERQSKETISEEGDLFYAVASPANREEDTTMLQAETREELINQIALFHQEERQAILEEYFAEYLDGESMEKKDATSNVKRRPLTAKEKKRLEKKYGVTIEDSIEGNIPTVKSNDYNQKSPVYLALAIQEVKDLTFDGKKRQRKSPGQQETDQKIREKVSEIESNKNFIKLSEDGTVYVNTRTGERYQRVTSVISDEEADPENEYLKSANKIGSAVDQIVRDFFMGELSNNYGVASQEDFDYFISQLDTIKRNMDARGETVLANNIVLYNDEMGIAGEVDLITYDKNGNFRIYDMKTMRGNQLEETHNSGDNKGRNKYRNPYNKDGLSNQEKHRRQLSLYRMLLNRTHGIKAKTIAVMPIEVSYEPGDTTTGTLNLLKGYDLRFDPLNEFNGYQLDDPAPVNQKVAVTVEDSEKQYQVTSDDRIISLNKKGKPEVFKRTDSPQRKRILRKAEEKRNENSGQSQPVTNEPPDGSPDNNYPTPNPTQEEKDKRSVKTTAQSKLPADYQTEDDLKNSNEAWERNKEDFNTYYAPGDEVEEEVTDNRLPEAAPFLATLDRQYTETEDGIQDAEDQINQESLDQGKDKSHLKQGELKPGDEIFLEIDRETEYTKEDYLSLVQRGDEEEGATRNDYIPIIAKRKITNANGETVWVPFANLHTKDYVNTKRVRSADEVERANQDIARLRAIRDKVISEDGITVKMKDVGNGTLIQGKEENGTDQKQVAKAFPDESLDMGVVTNRGIKTTSGNNLSYDNILNADHVDEYPGKPIVMVPAGNEEGKMIAAPVNPIKLGDRPVLADTVMKAVKVTLRQNKSKRSESDKNFLAVMKKLGYDLEGQDRHKNLRRFIDNFLYNIQLKGDDSLKSLSGNFNSNSHFVSLMGNTLEFSRGGGVNYGMLDEIQEEQEFYEELEKFHKHLKEMRLNLNIEQFGDEPFTVPFYDAKEDQMKTKTYNNYKEFLRNNLTTDLRSFNIGTQENPEHVYTIHKQMRIDLESVIGEEYAVDDEADDNNTDIDDTLNSNNDGDDLPDLDDALTLSPEGDDGLLLRDESNLNRLIISDRINMRKQNDLINAVAAQVYKRAIRDKETNQDEVYLDEFEKLGGSYEKDGLKQKLQKAVTAGKKTQEQVQPTLDDIDEILNNWDRLRKIVNYNLNRVANIDTGVSDSILEDTEQEKQIDREEEAREEQDDYNEYNEDSRYLADPRDKLKEHKRILAFTKNLTVKKDVNTGENIFETDLGFLGKERYLSFEEAYNTVFKILAGSRANFNDQVATLKKYTTAYPFLVSVIENFENASPDSQNAIASHFASHRKVNQVDVRYDNDGDGTKYGLYDSNQNEKDNAVIRSWDIGLFNSDLTYQDETDPTDLKINTDKARELRDEYKTMTEGRGNIPGIDEAKAWLEKVGINLSDATLAHLYENGMTRNTANYSWARLFTSRGGFFYELNQKLGDYLLEDKSTSLVENPFMNHSAYRVVAGIEAMYNPSGFSQTHMSGGKMIWSYTATDYMHDRKESLLNNKTILDNLASLPFNKESKWIQNQLAAMDENGKLAKPNLHNRVFDIKEVSLNPFAEKGALSKGKQYRDSTSLEKEGLKLAWFANNGATAKDGDGKKVRLGWLTTPTFGDRKAAYFIRQILTDVTFTNEDSDPNDPGLISDETAQELYDQMIRPEIDRIVSAQDKDITIDGYKEGSRLFFFMPSLNDQAELYNGDKLRTDIHSNPELKQMVIDELKQHVNTIIDEKVKTWEDLGVFKNNLIDIRHKDQIVGNLDPVTQQPKALNSKDKKKLAADFEINSMLSNANYFMAFAGDPALYYKAKKPQDKEDEVRQSAENLVKRLTGEDAPGSKENDADDGFLTMGMISDKTASSFAQKIYNVLTDEQKKDFQQDELEGMDAQEFIRLGEYIEHWYKEGQLDQETYESIKAKEAAVNKEKGETANLTRSEINKLLNVLKPLYNGNIYDKDNQVDRKVYVKSAAFPLIPELTKDRSLDNLRQVMERQGVDRAVGKTAMKAGFTTNPLEIWDANGEVKEDLEFGNDQLLKLPRAHAKIQQPNPPKKVNLTTLGSQETKMFATNVLHVDDFKLNGQSFTGQELKNMLDNTMGTQYVNDYKNLRDELEDDDGNVDIEKLKEIFQREGEARGFSLADLDALHTENGSFKVPIWTLGDRSQYEAVLNSIVTNRVLKRKMPGQSSIMITQEGFDVGNDKTFVNKQGRKQVQSNNSDMVYNPEWDGVFKPKRAVKIDSEGNTLYNEDGSEQEAEASTPADQKKIMPDQVALPFKFTDNQGNRLNLSDYTDKKGFLDTSKFSEELLNMYGFRIPTGGGSFTTNVQVVAFLPSNAGDAIISPRDLTKRMGSDYDNDKFITYQYNTQFDPENGRLSKIPDLSDDEITAFIQNLKSVDQNKDPEKIEVSNREFRKYQNYVAQNKGVDVRLSLHENPRNEVQAEMLRPEDTYRLRDWADAIKEVYEQRETREYSILSSNHQREIYEQIQSSAAGVGVKSNDNVFNSNIQPLDMKVLMNSEPMEIAFGGKVSIGDLSDPYQLTIEGVRSTQPKSNVHRVYQTIHLDHVSEQIAQYINSVPETFSAERAMAQLGFSENDIVAMMSQPIVREYVSKLKEIENPFNPIKGDKRDIALRQTKKKYPDEKYDDGEEYMDKIDKDMERMDSDDLFDLMKNQNQDNNPYYNATQKAILAKFQDFTKIGDKLQDIQTATSTDSKKVPSNQFESQAKQREIAELSVVNNKGMDIDQKERVIGQFSKEKESEDHVYAGTNSLGSPVYIKPETVSGYATVYGLMQTNKWFGPFFPYQSGITKEMLDEVKRIEHTPDTRYIGQAQRNREIFDDMTSFLFTKPEAGFKPTEEDTENTDIFMKRINLMIDRDNVNDSLPTIIEKIQKNPEIGPKSSFKKNAFINSLTSERNRQSKTMKSLRFNGGNVQALDDNDISAGIMELYDNNEYIGVFNGQDYYTRDLFKDLVMHQYLSGANTGKGSFLKYIPVSYLNKIGFGEYFKNLDFEYDHNIFGTVPNKIHYWTKSRYTRQRVQHRPDNQLLASTENVETENFIPGVHPSFKIASDEKTLEELYVKGRSDPDVDKTDPVPPEFLRFKDPTANTHLYEYVGNGEYVQIDKLGDSEMNEFLAEREQARSVFGENRTGHKKQDLSVRKDEKRDKQKKNSRQPTANYGDEMYGIPQSTTDSRTSEAIMTDILYSISRMTDSALFKTMAEEFQKKIKDSNITVEVRKDLPRAGGYSHETNTIYINPDKLTDGAKIENVMMEEFIHAFTVNKMKNDPNDDSVKRLKGIFSLLRERYQDDPRMKEVEDKMANRNKNAFQPGDKFYYYLSSPEEFLAGIVNNKQLIEELKSIPYDQERSFWQEILNRIVEVLKKAGIDLQEKTAYTYAISNLFDSITKTETDQKFNQNPNQNSNENPGENPGNNPSPNKLFNTDNKSLTPGAVAKYKDEKVIIWNVKDDGKVQIITEHDSKYSGTPKSDKVTVIGHLPVVEYDGTGYIATDQGNIYSTAKNAERRKVFDGDDGSSKKKRDDILRKAYEQVNQSVSTQETQEQDTNKGFQGHKGGFSDTGKGTAKGDGKDKAMRQAANSFIGEIDSRRQSSTLTSAKEIQNKMFPDTSPNIDEKGYFDNEDIGAHHIYSAVKELESSDQIITMLARNGKLKGRKLDPETKNKIKTLHENWNAEFIVGDMPDVDSQFIEYLQEIGATFTVYHTGKEPRINIAEQTTTETNQKPNQNPNENPDGEEYANVGTATDSFKIQQMLKMKMDPGKFGYSIKDINNAIKEMGQDPADYGYFSPEMSNGMKANEASARDRMMDRINNKPC